MYNNNSISFAEQVIFIQIHSKGLLFGTFSLILFDSIYSKGLVVKYQSEIFGIFWRSKANSITKSRVRAFNQMRWITVSVRWNLIIRLNRKKGGENGSSTIYLHGHKLNQLYPAWHIDRHFARPKGTDCPPK